MISRRWIAAGLVATAWFLGGCAPGPVTIAPPRVAQGGRALSIAITSNNNQRLVVATETGGLFRTFDGGNSWQHLDGLPNFRTVDVAIAWLAPDTIIATTLPQYRTVNDGGIWRSTDGGGTWSQPPGSAPPPGPNCTSRPGAYGISHMPLSRTFYVGTDCGLAVSHDDGATWSHTVLDPNAGSAGPFRYRVRSVLVINRTSGVAAADAGLWHLDQNGMWAKSQDVATSGQVPVTHAFAAPWWSGTSSIFLHASGGQKLWLSSDGGAGWTQVPAPSINTREAFVRVARALSGDQGKFDIYYGDGAKLHRQTFSFDNLSGSGGWTDLKSDHDDPSDIALDLDLTAPVLLATDGGVHRTADQGATWTLTGGGYGGFDALQIAEVTGQVFSGPPQHQNLYYGTQDNDIKASFDGGHSWMGSICCEGRFIRVSSGSIDFRPKVTGSACGPCSNFVAGPQLDNVRSWPNAPDGNPASHADAPFLIEGDAYLQDFVNTTASPPSFDFYFTSTAGISWSKSFSLTFSPKGASVFAGPAGNPTVYQGVQLPGSLPNGGMRLGLIRATGLSGQATVAAADGSGTVALGSLRTPIARYVVFGVDPANPNHLIAPDLNSDEMKFSADGGATWHPLPQLTQAVTGGGQYLFELFELSLASVISWDPYDSCHILVGTIQNGIIRSTDGGNTWAQIAGSKPVTYVSSFYFPPTGAVWVSTNGRGLWTLNLARQSGSGAGQCRFPAVTGGAVPADTMLAVDPGTGSSQTFRGLDDPAVCTDCSIIAVRNGWVTDLQTSGDELRELAISGGTISQVDRSGHEIPLVVPNVYRPGDGRLEKRIRGRAVTPPHRVRGLIMEGTRLRGVIAASGELPFAPPRTPMVFVFSADKAGTSSIESNETARVVGTGFLPASDPDALVRIRFDQEVVAERVPVQPDGSFSVDILVRNLPGEMIVTAEQRDGHRLTMERAIVDVMTKD